MRVSLIGKRYRGVIEGKYVEDRWTEMVNCEVGRHPESYCNRYYKCEAVISDAPVSSRYFSSFSISVDKEIPLIDALGLNFNKKKVKGEKRYLLLDIILSDMVQRIKSYDRVPHIAPRKFEAKELVEYGILPDKNGQYYFYFDFKELKGGK